jgi:hypothetical protein
MGPAAVGGVCHDEAAAAAEALSASRTSRRRPGGERSSYEKKVKSDVKLGPVQFQGGAPDCLAARCGLV